MLITFGILINSKAFSMQYSSLYFVKSVYFYFFSDIIIRKHLTGQNYGDQNLAAFIQAI